MYDKSSFLKSGSLAVRGLEWSLKAFKSYLKDKKRFSIKIKFFIV